MAAAVVVAINSLELLAVATAAVTGLGSLLFLRNRKERSSVSSSTVFVLIFRGEQEEG
jgi:hypothetical protein